ncbi:MULTISPECIES: FadR/GntR family transcriptional regulator [Variovorax]|jgi:GntR family transcriptional regulator, uxu operon transcriptional repressor|uniref:FadR/GntR family transcriptional regulator n=1 Tax=Variovorax TaxID=34072 RepID=UPI00086F5B0F|nr:MULTISPECIES: FadR/GntR family transcriptional regulator [Variovorax]MBN8751979.1 FadR family transcriptional regulator [Variovorax sp.]ODU17785.1 MAG: GntR family transcriptional regulator [Variovorax sp. SCN 67-85]ODV27142.1 MAG: GntR family transcriptional regulator [Variovorax sp. SCN 67-20]OJZ09202.1 MAG: GntR family transcriptional regulator [Variovorax sp. 67-131]UKI11676.1 FadR family transcriptional regulator [Variovorax paradoxus]
MATLTELPLVQAPEPESDRSYQKLAARIAGLITEGEFKAGDRLPSERALAERFNVSRTLVREAIIVLEIQGAVEVRGGSGIYICAPVAGAAVPAASAYTLSPGPGPFELLRARSLIESEIASVAAENRKDSDIDRIYAALAAMREHMQDKAANEAADRLFHLRIAESTGNSVLLQMVTALWDHTKAPIWSQMEAHFHTPELRRASQDDHQRVFNALLERNPAEARAAMRAHIDRVIAEFAQAWR